MVRDRSTTAGPALPVNGSIVALGILAASMLVMLLAAMGSRFGWWHFRTGFTLLGYGAYGSIAAAITGLGTAFLASRRRQAAAVGLALMATVGGFAVAAIPLSWRVKAKQLPAIHDITTDTNHPPEFVAILKLRQNAPNAAVYGGPAVAEAQKQAYGQLRTEVMDMPLSLAFDRALAAARAEGWKIVATEPASGRIEATDSTFWFGFTDDIVIRLAGAGQRTLLDIRSVSRVGKSDIGTNAERIRSYLKRLRAEASA